MLKGSAYGRFYNALAIGSNKASGYDDLDVLYSDMELAEMDNLNYDWLDKAGWKSAFQQTHTLNVTGGSERATYYAGATFLTREQIWVIKAISVILTVPVLMCV